MIVNWSPQNEYKADHLQWKKWQVAFGIFVVFAANQAASWTISDKKKVSWKPLPLIVNEVYMKVWTDF